MSWREGRVVDEIIFHRLVQKDLNSALESYGGISEELADPFYSELQSGFDQAVANPKFYHFDSCGLRRCNLHRFPYHFLYDCFDGTVRVWVLRHDHQRPSTGTRRFSQNT